MHVPMMENGRASDGMMVARALRRNRKITITTSATVSASVNCTSRTASSILSARLKTVKSLTPGGSCSSSCAISRSTPFAVATVFTPGWRMMESEMLLTPLISLKPRSCCNPSYTLPRSPSRTGNPLRLATTSCRNSAAFLSWPVACSVNA
jgi:hypothetical protein